ncbi:cytidylyltransferase domain-containing protein [Clostridium saccharobutylicum]|uniref:Acylneuraminate cytidylyltransferase n=1 Tax=Clostridium saccharobutylicum DSM 13864 TaxID=1345695 RepID=U5MZJ1_CLOSA|nr:glycosyltransferase family protein [Clostridium saccharobutylicum]AGX44912.1 acylneuraminate cytidylyltransferase [Clostridium saccharobutylicum DSM 13864]AQR92193.1 3-deoxy-manno-octulosonate cytidylyltransferase [Clostridium saccharobutylicum]AQS02095.1 3-deoxy-manno-octulosonate cytidylyltransferase [Clostridium saccharobutylicum]AQS11699.1 3-deoxy-manno-octulosonate cytidylyltransferase [Clostridium saccharobutylicum]AQS16078.1 3-deoxy-manno-octulosonate cytidylyltransferase [Clostridiu
MKVVCIIQARIGSIRLPGKILKKICDKTVLEHGIDRVRRIGNINDIVIATTTLERDNLVVEEAEKLHVKYYRGDEEDVLSRYYYAAKENNADVIVRITSDCPLIDYEVSKKIIQYYISNMDKYDYVSNTIDRTYPRGLDTEVFSFGALEKAFFQASSVIEREHVTPYIWNNPNMFKLTQYKNDIDYSKLRWTLDTKEDFDLINKIYDALYLKKNNNFNMIDVLKLYDLLPELYTINSEIEQKKI